MKFRTRKVLSAAVAGAALVSASKAFAAEPFPVSAFFPDPVLQANVYFQNFDTLPSDPTMIPTVADPTAAPGVLNDIPQADFEPLFGWEMFQSFNTAPTIYTVDDGASTAKNFIGSMGAPLDSERSLAVIGTTATSHGTNDAPPPPPGGAGFQHPAAGITFVNDTDGKFSGFRLSLTSEHWHQWDEFRGATGGMRFSYALGDENVNLQSGQTGAGVTAGMFVLVPELRVAHILPTGGSVQVNGNDPANQAILGTDALEPSGYAFFKLKQWVPGPLPTDPPVLVDADWDPGERLVLRWDNPNNGGNEDTLAIDDLIFFGDNAVEVERPVLKWDVSKGSGPWVSNPSEIRWIKTSASPPPPAAGTPVGFTNGQIAELVDNPATPITITVDSTNVIAGELNVKHTAGTYIVTGGRVNGGPLNKTGAGTLILASPNGFNAANIDGGVVETRATGALGTTSVTFVANPANPTTFRVTGETQTMGGFTGSTTTNGVLTIDIQNTGATGATSDLLVNGQIGGSAGTTINKIGPGSIQAGLNAITDARLNILEGTWRLGDAVLNDPLNESTIVTISAGATADESFGNGETQGAVAGDGTYIVAVGGYIRSSLNDPAAVVTFGGTITAGFNGQPGTTDDVLSILVNEIEKGDTYTWVLTDDAQGIFVGPVSVIGGVLSVGVIGNQGEPSPLGFSNLANPAAPGPDIVLETGGIFRYTGPSTSTDRIFGTTTGSGVVEVANAASTLTLTNGMAGVAGNTFTKSGPGTMVLAANNSEMAGDIAVNGGTLVLPVGTTHGIGSSSVVAQSTATSVGRLAGTGTVAGTLRSTVGGSIAPGELNATTGASTIGTLTTNALNLDGAVLDFQLGAGTASDKINVTGADGAATQASTSFFSLTNLGPTPTLASVWTVIEYVGADPAESAFDVLNPIIGGGLFYDAFVDAADDAVKIRVVNTNPVPRWILDANGAWSVSANWNGGVPNAPGAIARFLGDITANRTVTVDGNFTVGTMIFNNATASYTIAGSAGNAITLQGGAQLIDVQAGNHNINANVLINAGVDAANRNNNEVRVATGASVSIGGGLNIPDFATVTKTGGGTANVPGGIGFAATNSLLNVNEGTLDAGELIGAAVIADPPELDRNVGDVNVGTATSTATLRATVMRFDDLNVAAGSTAQIKQSGGGPDAPSNDSTAVLETVTLGEAAFPPAANSDPVGKFDITNNKVIIKDEGAATTADKLARLRNQLIKGRNVPVGGAADGKWDGATGIVSSTAATANVAGGSEARSIGYMVNGQGVTTLTEFGGQPVQPGDLLVRYTRNADFNLDGVVNDNDVSIASGFYNVNHDPNGPLGPRHWFQGDTNFNGIVEDNDISVLSGFYLPTATPIAGAEGGFVAVPEPGTIGVLAIGALGLLARRRRNA